MEMLFRSFGTLHLFSLAIYAGGCVYIATVDMPALATLTPHSYLGAFSEMLPRAGRLMLPLLLLALVSGGLAAFSQPGGQRVFMLGATAVLVAIVALTASQIIPLNKALLSSGALSEPQILAIRSQWNTWHGVRTTLSVVALLFAWAGIR